jgi:hypothetical protein
MRRARDAQMARLAARSAATDDAASRHIATLRARVKIGMVLRQALGELGIDPATVAMLRIADEAALELAVTADGAAGPDPGMPQPMAGDRSDSAAAAAFAARIEASLRGYRDGQGIDFAQASLAEALAWCLARLENSSPPETVGTSEKDGARLFAADLLQKQQDGVTAASAEV